jgi:hypothetical protein
MYNELCNKQNDSFFLVGHICIRDKDHQMNFKKHINHLISSNQCACFMKTFSSFIIFYNVNNNFKGFRKLQKYFRFIQ